MSFDFNVFALVLLIIGSANLFLAVILFQRNGEIVKWFASLMFFISLWSIAYSFELASSTLEQMLFFIKVEYLGIAFLPAIWVVFVLHFVNKAEWLTKANLSLIFFISIIEFTLVISNNYHKLQYKTVTIDNSDGIPLLSFSPGIVYIIHTVYFYCMLIFGMYLLINTLVKGYFIYKKQYISIILAALIPWITNLIYIVGYRPFGHIDLTPYAFIITSSTIAFSLLRHSLFNLIPIAREKVIENMSEGVIIIDSQHRILDINSVVLKFLNATHNEIIGKNLLEIIDDKALLTEHLQAANGIHFTINTHNRKFDITANEINPMKGVYKGSLLIFRDITESELAKEKLEKQTKELEELNRLKDKLFSIIAHDLKAPFASLVSMLRIVNDNDISPEEFKAYLPKLTENVDYTSTLLENLLNWSKSQIDAVKVVVEPILLKDLVEVEITFFNKLSAEKNIQIINEITNYYLINADRNTVQLVFRNLFSNAIKFCKSGDSIIVSTQIINDKETVIFKDTGIGMSADKVEKLFGSETFTTFGTDNEKGTGLGLLLCKDFLNKTGGKIHVESEVGVGTTFYIQFSGN
ncbi:MAG: histidine kinase N-terminal 7TM domain-containing protein [Bacteroidia bacterium]